MYFVKGYVRLPVKIPAKVIHVVGARPNFMKIAPIVEEMARYPDRFEQLLVHTGQHGNGTLLGRRDVPGLLR
jgi:UDP-N-acetylglucosamine 2-epimerase